jgi:hypothetical protein
VTAGDGFGVGSTAGSEVVLVVAVGSSQNHTAPGPNGNRRFGGTGLEWSDMNRATQNRRNKKL